MRHGRYMALTRVIRNRFPHMSAMHLTHYSEASKTQGSRQRKRLRYRVKRSLGRRGIPLRDEVLSREEEKTATASLSGYMG